VSLLGIARVGFARSSAVNNKHAETENYNSLEKRLAQTEENNAQLRGQLSVVASRLQLTPDEEAAAQCIADRVHGMDAQQIAKVDAELRSELNAKANARDLDIKANGSKLAAVNAKSTIDVTAVRKEVATVKKDMEANVSEVNKQLERNHHEIELLRTTGQHNGL
jgi:hypothetical protein